MKKKTLWVVIPSSALAGILVVMFFTETYMKRAIQSRIHVPDDTIESSEPYYFSDKKDNILGMKLVREQNSRVMPDEPGYVTGRLDFSKSAGRSTSGPGKESEDINPELLLAQGPVIVIQPTLPATGQGEWIIRTGNVSLEVENGKDAYKKVSKICQELGGYLASSNFYLDREGREAGSITMRIPKDKFLTALDSLGALGKTEHISTDSQDVRQQYVNLKAELDAAMVVYNKMLEALQKRQVSISEAIRLESELTPVLRRVEDLKNQIEALNNSVAFTTININFHEARISGKLFKESIRSLKEGLIQAAVGAIRFVAAAIPVLVVVALLAMVAIGVVLVFKHWVIKFFKRD